MNHLTASPKFQTAKQALKITLLALFAGTVLALAFSSCLTGALGAEPSAASGQPSAVSDQPSLSLAQMLVPIVVPLLIAGLKKILPQVPPALLPLLAPLLGFIADACVSLATGGAMNPILGAVLGSAGVGVREALKHFKPAPAISAGTATLLFALALPFLFTGCAAVEQSAYQKNTDPSTGIVDERESRTKVRATGDAKQMVEKLRVTNTSKTQSLGTDGVSQESSLQGLVDLFKVFFDAGKEAGKKTVAPATP